MFNRIVVDADSLLYRCGFAAEGEPVSHACHNLKLQIQSIKEALGTDNAELYIKGKGNFRKDIAVSCTYKGTRTMRVPTHYPALRDYIKEVHGAKEVDGMEADDICSAILFEYSDRESGVVVAAMDKDLWNTPGWHFNYDPRKWTTSYVTISEADYNFLFQLVVGDRSDNVPGLPRLAQTSVERLGIEGVRSGGVAETKAKRILNSLNSNQERLEEIWTLYQEYGKEVEWSESDVQDYFVEQGRLLWMTRRMHADGTPVLWEPPEGLLSKRLRSEDTGSSN
jgi:hypothetical protein